MDGVKFIDYESKCLLENDGIYDFVNFNAEVWLNMNWLDWFIKVKFWYGVFGIDEKEKLYSFQICNFRMNPFKDEMYIEFKWIFNYKIQPLSHGKFGPFRMQIRAHTQAHPSLPLFGKRGGASNVSSSRLISREQRL